MEITLLQSLAPQKIKKKHLITRQTDFLLMGGFFIYIFNIHKKHKTTPPKRWVVLRSKTVLGNYYFCAASLAYFVTRRFLVFLERDALFFVFTLILFAICL